MPVPPVNDTLRWVVGGFRILSWIWVLMLVVVILVGDKPGRASVLAIVVAVATAWTVVTVWAARTHERMTSAWFFSLDTVIALSIGAAGLIAGTEDFVSGGWPNSWLFVVAYVTSMRWTLVAGFVLAAEHAVLHLLHDLDAVRIAGTFQFIVFALIAGWAFDTLREREALRLEAQAKLAEQERQNTRHEARVELARQLHDSYLQTLVSTRAAAKDPEQVRYLTRRQERELRRTIAEFQSPFFKSFRVALMRCRDEVNELYPKTEIDEVIRDDAAVTPALEAALGASREAMLNAAKHSATSEIDIYSELNNGLMTIHIRDRGTGFDAEKTGRRGMMLSMVSPVEAVGGRVTIASKRGEGTEVTIEVPTDA